MLKKNIKPVLLAGALALATAVSPVLANDDQNTVDTSNPNAITVNKTLNFAEGINSIDETFSYNVVPKSYYTYKYIDTDDQGMNELVTDETTDLSNVSIPSFEIGSTTFNFNTEDNAIHQQDTTLEFSLENSSVLPGFYVYEVTEVTTDHPTTHTNDTVTYNTTSQKYKVIVRVVNNDTYTGTEIDGIEVRNASNNKVESIDFVNTYDEMTSFTLSKEITGKGADMNKTFEFEVKFTAPETSEVTSTSGKVGNTEYSFDLTANGSATTVTLGNNDSITVSVPAGTTYEITEKDATDYDTTYSQIQNEEETKGEGKVVEESIVYDVEGESVAYTNNKDSNPLTGVIVNNMPYIALLGASGAGLVVLAASKKRSK